MGKVIAIVAMDESRVIGYQGIIPWHISEDFKRFSSLTKKNIVLMGSKTYFSLPDKFRPLPDRENWVLSKHPEKLQNEEIKIFSSIESALQEYNSANDSRTLWVIGGANIYQQAIKYCDEITVSLVPGSHTGDTFFPKFEQDFILKRQTAYEGFTVLDYSRK